MTDYFHLNAAPDTVRAISSLGLAHLGDGVFELMVRSWLCLSGRARVENLHRAGLFSMKGAVSEVAAQLGASEATVYRYLSKLKG